MKIKYLLFLWFFIKAHAFPITYKIIPAKDAFLIGEPVLFTLAIINHTQEPLFISNWGDCVWKVVTHNPRVFIKKPGKKEEEILGHILRGIELSKVLFSSPPSIEYLKLLPQDTVFLTSFYRKADVIGVWKLKSQFNLRVENINTSSYILSSFADKHWKAWRRDYKNPTNKHMVYIYIFSLRDSSWIKVESLTLRYKKAYKDYLKYEKEEISWKEYYKTHPDSPYLPYILYQEIIKAENQKEMEKMASLLTKNYSYTYWAKRINLVLGDRYFAYFNNKEKAKENYLKFIQKNPKSLDSFILLKKMKKWGWIE